jgi:hypothetical protein
MFRKASAVITVCILGLFLSACDRLKIGDINADPGRFQNKEVSVAGKVTGLSIGALNTGLYEIDDGTGKLYVLSSSRGAPSKDAYVGVKGKIMPTFTFLGRNYATVLRESDRRAVRASELTSN